MTPRPLRARLSTGFHAYRQLGPVRGSKALVRYAVRTGHGHARRFIVEHRPIQASQAEVTAALGGREPRAALAEVGRALPSLERWCGALDAVGPAERERLVEVADRVCAHRFDLLGSGPVDLGPEIDWHVDFKSGRRWPLHHISRIVVSYPDTSDIKVPWELSRGQHLPLLAAANLVTRDPAYVEELGQQLTSWIEANPVEFGPNWQCTMDVAIRAANWVAALALWANNPQAPAAPWLPRVIASLLLHARFIRSHLESGPARGNHYLADVAGLLVVAGIFRTSAEGRHWIEWAVDQLALEMAHQVRADGCDHEASIPYHRLVAEMFIVAADAADFLAPGRLAPMVREGIERMLAFTADYTRPDGLAPQIGDADDGRFLPLGDYGTADHRSHLHLFRQAGGEYRAAASSASYPHGGFYFLRSGELYTAVRCGDVGIYGRGCHAHNDVLSFELCWREVPLIVDPGSYLYTADPVQRNRFRATATHATLQVDDREQNEFRADRLFAMVERAEPEMLRWEPGERISVFVGRHRGFATAGEECLHTRTLTLDAEAGELRVLDEIESSAPHQLTWRFPLASCNLATEDRMARAEFGGVRLEIDGGGLPITVEEGWLSPAYGVRHPAPVVVIRGASNPGHAVTALSLRVRPADSA